MKTKILFASMVLPTLFAACTAEDLVQNQNAGTALEGRALLSPLTINVSDETPTTRFSWNEATGGWNDFTANDKFSAGLVDAAGNVGDKVYTNYVYSSADGVSYTTTSQMVEGVYMFYSYKGFETSASRGTVDFNLTAQTADLADPTKTVEENQLFVTPLYKLEAENANDNLNMKFVSYWSTAAIKIQNASEAPFKIVRMVLNGDFAAKGSLSPFTMNTKKYVYTYDKDTQAFVLDAANAGKEGQKTYEDFLTDGIADVPSNADVLVLDCGSYEVEAGKEVMAYMQVPAGKYNTNMTVDIVVETTDSKGASILKQLEAEVVKNEKSKADKTENDQTAMYRGQTTALFGYNDDKTPKAYKIDKIALLSAVEADGAYASSFDDVYNLVTEAEGDYTVADPLEIYNIGDVKVDDEMVDLLSRMGVVVKFANPIDIELESTANTTIKNIVFAGNVTLKKGSVTLGDNISVGVDATTAIPATLTINEGTSAKITATTAADCNYKVATIVNNGTLELATASLEIAEVTNENADGEAVGEIVVAKDVTFGNTTSQVNVIDAAAKLTINEGAELTLNAAYTVAYGQEIINNGEIKGSGTLTNNGTITNNAKGTISAVINEGVAKVGTTPAKVAKIDNFGTITTAKLMHDSEVVMKAATAIITTTTETSNDPAGKIDNSIGAFVTNTGGDIVYINYTTDQDGAKLGNVMGCNTIYASNCELKDVTMPTTGINTVEFNNVTLSVTPASDSEKYGDLAIAPATVVLKGCTVNADLTLSTTLTADSKFENTEFNGTSNFANGASNTLSFKYVKFNDDVTLNGSTTTLNLTGVEVNADIDGSTKNLATVNINADADKKGVVITTTINGAVKLDSDGGSNQINIAKDAVMSVTIDGAIGGGTVTIDNDGKVYNQGEIATGTADQPAEDANWVGNKTVASLS